MAVIAKAVKGYTIPIGASNTDTSGWMNTSGRIFRLESLIVTNLSGEGRVQIFDAGSAGWDSTRTIVNLKVGQAETVTLDRDELVGAEFISGMYVQSTVSSGSTWVRVGGYEY